MYFVYALYNKSVDKIYIGFTSNLERRLKEHNLKSGNHFTAYFDGEWILIYKEELSSKAKSLVREKQLKSFKGREFIRKHIPR